MPDGGHAILAEFNRAHPRVRELFWAALRREIDREHDLCGRVEAAHGVSPNGYKPRLRWDDSWRRRAKSYRIAEEVGWSGADIAAQKERLREIPTEDYVPCLSGEDFERGGKMRCPLPNHDERTPSFHVRRDNRWQCFGCGSSGDIYNLAALLWDYPLHGSGFLDLHKRLMELFG
jgi:CHC2 zinc finger